jgi:hypothetical protein
LFQNINIYYLFIFRAELKIIPLVKTLSTTVASKSRPVSSERISLVSS